MLPGVPLFLPFKNTVVERELEQSSAVLVRHQTRTRYRYARADVAQTQCRGMALGNSRYLFLAASISRLIFTFSPISRPPVSKVLLKFKPQSLRLITP